MSEQKPEVDGDKGRGKSVWTIPAVRDYALVCLAALLMVALIMLQDPIGLIALLPVLVGIISLAIFWAAGPVLVLLTLTILCLLRRQFFVTMMPGFQQPTEGFDLILGLVLAIYCIGHYRLQSLVRNASPYDYRRDRRISTRRVKGRWTLPEPVRKRGGRKVQSLEVGLMLLAGVIATLVGYLLWTWVASELPPVGFPMGVPVWHLVVLIWLGALALMGAGAVLGYLERAQAGPEESLLYLQDQLWTQTRGEQRRIQRWMVWLRLKRQKQQEEKG